MRMKDDEKMRKEDLIKMKVKSSCLPTNLENSGHRHPQLHSPASMLTPHLHHQSTLKANTENYEENKENYKENYEETYKSKENNEENYEKNYKDNKEDHEENYEENYKRWDKNDLFIQNKSTSAHRSTLKSSKESYEEKYEENYKENEENHE